MAGSIPPHIKSIAIPLAENQTAEFGMSEAVTDNMVNEFTAVSYTHLTLPTKRIV